MKKVLFFLLSLVTLSMSAQDAATPETAAAQQAPALKYGYLSYEAVFKAMPDYATMQASMTQLREKYEAEQKRVETDFNKKYEEFLDGQKNFPKSILEKRQVELQEMLDKNIAFKKESQRLLKQAEEDAMAPIQARLATALETIGRERGYAFIINTDEKAALWLNPSLGEDVSEAVIEQLQKEEK